MPDIQILDDDAELAVGELDAAAGARPLSLEEALPLLVSPDTGRQLRLDSAGNRLVAEAEVFPLRNGLPLLLPARAQRVISGGQWVIPHERWRDPFLQYLLLSWIKQIPHESNLAADDVWYRRHLARARRLLADARGTFLDVGCDDVRLARSILSPDVIYVGLDPLLEARGPFRLIAMAEFLPFADASFDNIAFMTSLDHVLDHHRAIDEACRVLRPGGRLYLATLVWTHDAELFHDHVHFHHFREYEIRGALAGLDIESVSRYSWKDDAHRHGMYLRASKP